MRGEEREDGNNGRNKEWSMSRDGKQGHGTRAREQTEEMEKQKQGENQSSKGRERR